MLKLQARNNYCQLKKLSVRKRLPIAKNYNKTQGEN